jgi:hypothetical protein
MHGNRGLTLIEGLEATADEAGESRRVQPQIASSQWQLAVHRSFSEAFLDAQTPTIG